MAPALLLALAAAAGLAGTGCQVRRQAAPVGVGLLAVEAVGRATDRAALSPTAWSPDGRRFAYGGRDGVWVHAVGDPAGIRLTSGEVVTAVAWSSSADALAFVDRGTLWTIRPDGGDRRKIPIPGLASMPVWAPGGDRLAVVVRRVGEQDPGTSLWVTSPDGATLRRILWEPQARRVAGLGWFPDALHLFVALAGAQGEATAEWWKVRIAYPDARRLAGPPVPAMEPVLSPGGRWLAYVASEAGGERVYAVRPDGSGLHPTSQAAFRISGLAWSPHGEVLAYGRLQSDEQAEIHLTAIPGGATRQVATYRLEFPDPAAGLSLAWSPDGVRLAFGTNTGALTGPVWLARFRLR